VPAGIVGPDPLTFDAKRTSTYERAAAFGLSHALFAKSPGGVLATAKRTASFRRLVDHAVSGSGIDPDLVEAIIFLESAGRPDVIAGSDPVNAAGRADPRRNGDGLPRNARQSERQSQAHA
jgi:hypothetical protein